MTDDLDPFALEQLAHDVAADGDAANVLDLAARDGLTVGNDGQRLEEGARVARLALFPQATDMPGDLAAGAKAPATRDLGQLDAAPVVISREFGQHLAQRLAVRRGAILDHDQLGQALQRQRGLGDHQQRLDDGFELLGIHLVAHSAGLGAGEGNARQRTCLPGACHGTDASADGTHGTLCWEDGRAFTGCQATSLT